jgi:solute carrier family 29 (equilibrative nucleoside transporter), member 1/2/3
MASADDSYAFYYFISAFNGIFQNSVYGVAARLPPSYTGAVVLGSNVAGLLASIASVLSVLFSGSPKTSAVYYFLTALFILLACFDTYFALPLNVGRSVWFIASR